VRQEEKATEDKALELLSFFGPRLLSMCNEPAYSLSYANRRRLAELKGENRQSKRRVIHG
jgi:branched-chain amino acid transport system ATP-binding protein